MMVALILVAYMIVCCTCIMTQITHSIVMTHHTHVVITHSAFHSSVVVQERGQHQMPWSYIHDEKMYRFDHARRNTSLLSMTWSDHCNNPQKRHVCGLTFTPRPGYNAIHITVYQKCVLKPPSSSGSTRIQ